MMSDTETNKIEKEDGGVCMYGWVRGCYFEKGGQGRPGRKGDI